MTLVANATNQQGNAAITYKNNGIDHSQEINYTSDNGVALSGTITGVVNTSNSEISFAVNQMISPLVNII